VGDDHRRVHCARCRGLLRICAACDRGQRYCADPCRDVVRRSSVRAAGQRYQDSLRGRRAHALRQQRYRERRAQKVTHHASTASPPAPTLRAMRSSRASLPISRAAHRNDDDASHLRCDFCGQPCSERVRVRHPWR
jgi:hypothetical protein